MNVNLLLSVDLPVNWGTVVRTVNAHRPSKLSLFHFPRDNSSLKFGKPPVEMENWLDELGISINSQIVEDGIDFSSHNDLDTFRLDVLSGTTFAQICIHKHALEQSIPLEVWATPSIGTTCVRLDSEGSFESPHIDLLRALELTGKISSWKEVEPTGINFGILKHYLNIIKRADRTTNKTIHLCRLNLNKLKKEFHFDQDTCKIILKDNSEFTLELDGQEEEGFWLEDIVAEVFSRLAIQSSAKAIRNFTIDQRSEKVQLINGIKRLFRNKPSKILPRIRLELSVALGIDPWRYPPKSPEYKKHARDMNSMVSNLRELVSQFTYDEIFNVGAVNEFDLLMVGEEEITTIEVKTIKPSLSSIGKLNTLIERQITPLKKRGIMVHAYFPVDEEEEKIFAQEKAEWEKMFPNITVIYWVNLPGIDFSNKSIKRHKSTTMSECSMHLEVLKWLTENNSPVLRYYYGVKRGKKGGWMLQINCSEKKLKYARKVLSALFFAIPELSQAKVVVNKVK